MQGVTLLAVSEGFALCCSVGCMAWICQQFISSLAKVTTNIPIWISTGANIFISLELFFL
jgi:di/tricarboxylate transporter